MVTACRSSCETTAQPKQSFPPSLSRSLLLSLFVSLPLCWYRTFFWSSWKWFSCDIMVWITCAKIIQLYSNNIVAKGEETNGNKSSLNCPQPGADTPQTVSEVLILSLMRLACMSPALITSADCLRIDMRGSPLFWTLPVEVTVTGGEVAVQSNYTPDDGWVIARDWQEGYRVRLPCTAPWRLA